MGRHLACSDAGRRVGRGEGGVETSGPQRDDILGKEGVLIGLLGCSHILDVLNQQLKIICNEPLNHLITYFGMKRQWIGTTAIPIAHDVMIV